MKLHLSPPTINNSKLNLEQTKKSPLKITINNQIFEENIPNILEISCDTTTFRSKSGSRIELIKSYYSENIINEIEKFIKEVSMN